MSHSIRIKDEVFSMLDDQASEAGVTPDVWVELKVKESAANKRKTVSERKKREALKNFTGAGDSRNELLKSAGAKTFPLQQRVDQIFGQVVTKKMKRIGIKLPK